MLATVLFSETENRVEFSYSALHSVSDESGCYALAAYDGTILYIGQSENICKRMEQHLDDGEKRKKTPWGVAFWMYYKLCPSRDLNSTERGWMNEHKIREGKRPFFNKIDAPV